MPRGMPNTPELVGKLPVPVLLYLLTVMVPILFNVGPLAMSLQRLMLLIITVPLLVNIFSSKYGKVLPIDILFLLHIFWAGLAIAAINPDQVIQQIGSIGMEFLGGYAIGRAYIRSKEDFVALCKLLIVLVCLTTPFAILETLTGRVLLVEFLNKLPGVRSVAVVIAPERMGFDRVQAVFAHPIHYGLFCSVAFSLCFVALNGLVSTGMRILLSAVILFSGFLALSSGALLALILQIALIAWAMIFANVKQRWWILVGLFVLAYIVIDLLSNRTPIRVFMSYATFSAHNAYWRGLIFEWGIKSVFGDASEGIPRSLLFGIGLNDWVRPHFMNSGSMDNFWLVIVVRYGVPGFCFLAGGYVYGVAKIMRRDFDTDLRMTLFRRAWIFTMLGLSFTLCTVHVWNALYSFVFFMFGAGMWMIHYQSDDTSEGIEANTSPDTQAKARSHNARASHRTGSNLSAFNRPDLDASSGRQSMPRATAAPVRPAAPDRHQSPPAPSNLSRAQRRDGQGSKETPQFSRFSDKKPRD